VIELIELSDNGHSIVEGWGFKVIELIELSDNGHSIVED
jgi:hypothetical protein